LEAQLRTEVGDTFNYFVWTGSNYSVIHET